MESSKLFISHSYKDKLVSDALVELLVRVGIKEENIISSSTPGTQISTGAPLYEELRVALKSDDTFVIFLLSDNFYSSPVCLNEMGAAWVRDLKFQYMLLPGFSFEKIRGVILHSHRIGISLAPIDEMTQERFFELKKVLECHFETVIQENIWERARRNFFEQVRLYEKQKLENISFDMQNVQGFCVGDLENGGCRIRKRESSRTKTVTTIDFSLTETKLCSIVFHTEQHDWLSFLKTNKQLCFDIYSDLDAIQAEIEISLKDRAISFAILVSEDTQHYKIPLTQFTSSTTAWSEVKEIRFLFRRKNVDHRTVVVIENLHLEG